jgi:hypothetical protein
MRAVLVPSEVSRRLKAIDIDRGLQPLKDIVGGYIEMVRINEFPALHGYINEEGKLDQLPINVRATSLVYGRSCWGNLHDVIVGDMVILASKGPEEAAVNLDDINEILALDYSGVLLPSPDIHFV